MGVQLVIWRGNGLLLVRGAKDDGKNGSNIWPEAHIGIVLLGVIRSISAILVWFWLATIPKASVLFPGLFLIG